MTIAVFLPSLFRGWRAALLLALVSCATPDRAMAACGSHVIVLNAPQAAVEHTAPAPFEVPAHPKPCRGPDCSGAPDHHAPPSAPTPTAGGAKDVIRPTAGDGRSGEGAGQVAEDITSSNPVRRTSSIFHPPRLD